MTETSSLAALSAGTETDQSTSPPDADSVIVPVPGAAMSSSAGPTLSVPAAESLGDAVSGTEVSPVAASVGLGLGVGWPAVALAVTVAAALAVGVSVARGL